ncbi:MAG TPA: LysR family transcriptional regulator [Myxococcus sp.]|nr:LysR family transcriptional regulator [Myxococcus sp.]
MAFTPLNALNAFLAVARRRSFTAAASELGISTSALSQSVRQLEERLGVALLSGTRRFIVVGSPAYLERRGTPQKPKDLLEHACISARLTSTGALYQWELERGKKSWRIPVRGPIVTNDGHLMREMAEAGVGLAYHFEPLLEDSLRRGALRVVLEPYAASVPGLFLYFPSRAQVSPALRAFVDVAREEAGRRLGE